MNMRNQLKIWIRYWILGNYVTSSEKSRIEDGTILFVVRLCLSILSSPSYLRNAKSLKRWITKEWDHRRSRHPTRLYKCVCNQSYMSVPHKHWDHGVREEEEEEVSLLLFLLLLHHWACCHHDSQGYSRKHLLFSLLWGRWGISSTGLSGTTRRLFWTIGMLRVWWWWLKISWNICIISWNKLF